MLIIIFRKRLKQNVCPSLCMWIQPTHPEKITKRSHNNLKFLFQQLVGAPCIHILVLQPRTKDGEKMMKTTFLKWKSRSANLGPEIQGGRAWGPWTCSPREEPARLSERSEPCSLMLTCPVIKSISNTIYRFTLTGFNYTPSFLQ